MTVQEWVTSPWHYACLPYQAHHILFEDGETYSEGCRRCSRPFHEYEYMYSWYLRSPKGTAHFQTSYFRATPDGEALDLTKAALPFHDPAFWTDPIGTPVTERDQDT
eukprot:scaffold144336_cov118-Phaeocystis_antarctica.AAC.1